MFYSSLMFIYGFLPVSLLVFYITPKKHRDLSLLIMSMLFCASFGAYYLLLMSVFTVVNYGACLLTEKLKKKGEISVLPFAAGIVFDILLLFIFRTSHLVDIRNALGVPKSFFPFGISLSILAAIGVLVDVYTGKMPADRNLLHFSLYFMFFPRLLMGPLLRYSSFSKMLREKKSDLSEMGIGFTIFVKGLVKKVIAADNLYMLYSAVNMINVHEMSSLTAWLGVTAYLLCLYFTLSGFSDMGTGIGYCFGIRMPQSFNYPILSARISHFSARWHVQVIQWFRRYVTKPLSSLTGKKAFRRLSLITAWGILGFWYSFSLNGMIWGAIMGIGVLAERVLDRYKLLGATSVLYTYLIAIFAAVFLAGDTPMSSVRYIFAMLDGNHKIVDAQSIYFLKSYIVLILICMYACTDLFRNMLMRSGKTKVKTVISAVSPVIVFVLLVISTVLISYNGTSGMLLMKL